MANSNSNISTGFTTLLSIAFIVLKLCDVIKWKWIWVLSPIWISACIAIITIIFAYAFYLNKKKKISKTPKGKWKEQYDKMVAKQKEVKQN